MGDDKPVVIKQNLKARSASNNKKIEKPNKINEEAKEIENFKKKNQQIKRGQHGKLKKMKEKYKDQDEDERRLRMEILKVSFIFLPKISNSVFCRFLCFMTFDAHQN